jgi:HK97 family phage major capsid protein
VPYNDLISADATDDALIPVPVAREIIQQIPQASATLALSRRITMSSRTQRMPVLSVLPLAYFVGGDIGLKQSTSADWKNVNLNVEEIAVLVPVPEAYLDDAQMPIWDEVRPLVVEAIGGVFDAATLFGTNKPVTWPTAIYPGTLAAGNVIVKGAGSTDIAQNVTTMGEELAKDGFPVSGFAARPGFNWNLLGLRSAGSEKLPIYEPDMQNGRGGNLYGFPMREVANGAWDSSEAELIGGDWSKSIVGVRQDITFTRHTDGVITDADGLVVMNAMQQDSVIFRAVFRAAWATANPSNRLKPTYTDATRYPFATVQATTANS